MTTSKATISMLEFIDENKLHSHWPQWTDEQLAHKCKELCEAAVAAHVSQSSLPGSMRRALADWVQTADWLLVAQAVRSRSANRIQSGMVVALAESPREEFGVVVYVGSREGSLIKRDIYIRRHDHWETVKIQEEQLVPLVERFWFAEVADLPRQEPARSPEDAMVLVLFRYAYEELDELPDELLAREYEMRTINNAVLASHFSEQLVERVRGLGLELNGFRCNEDVEQAAREFVRYATRMVRRPVETGNVVTKSAAEVLCYLQSSEAGYVPSRLREWAQSHGIELAPESDPDDNEE